MTPVIPFIDNIAPGERKLWLKQLNAVFTCGEVQPLATLSETLCERAEVAIVANASPRDIDRLPNLRWVQSVWAGVDSLIPILNSRSVAIVRLSDPNLAVVMAEAVVAWCLYLHRDMPLYAQQQSKALWRQAPVMAATARTVGVLGLGQLGTAAARKLQQFGFNTLGWSLTEKQIEKVETFSGDDGLQFVVGHSDILVILLPLTDATRGLIDERLLRSMKDGASLINFARGSILRTDALLTQLNKRHLNHAVLDVFEEEPLSSSSSLWSNPNVTILPHISAPTNKRSAALLVATNIKKYLENGVIPPAIDLQNQY